MSAKRLHARNSRSTPLQLSKFATLCHICDAMAEKSKTHRRSTSPAYSCVSMTLRLHRERESQKIGEPGKLASKAYWVTEIP